MLAQMCGQMYVSSNIGFLLFPDNGYRECLANGSWAARVNYSECQEILNEEVRIGHHPVEQARASSTSQGTRVGWGRREWLPHEQLGPGELSRSWCEDSTL